MLIKRDVIDNALGIMAQFLGKRRSHFPHIYFANLDIYLWEEISSSIPSFAVAVKLGTFEQRDVVDKFRLDSETLVGKSDVEIRLDNDELLVECEGQSSRFESERRRDKSLGGLFKLEANYQSDAYCWCVATEEFRQALRGMVKPSSEFFLKFHKPTSTAMISSYSSIPRVVTTKMINVNDCPRQEGTYRVAFNAITPLIKSAGAHIQFNRCVGFYPMERDSHYNAYWLQSGENLIVDLGKRYTPCRDFQSDDEGEIENCLLAAPYASLSVDNKELCAFLRKFSAKTTMEAKISGAKLELACDGVATRLDCSGASGNFKFKVGNGAFITATRGIPEAQLELQLCVFPENPKDKRLLRVVTPSTLNAACFKEKA